MKQEAIIDKKNSYRDVVEVINNLNSRVSKNRWGYI